MTPPEPPIITVAEAPTTDCFGITPCQTCGGRGFIVLDDVHLGTAYNGDPIIASVKQTCSYCNR